MKTIEAVINQALFKRSRVFQHILKHPNADRQTFGVTRTAYPFDKDIDVGSAEGDVSRHLVHVKNKMLSQRGLTKADFEHGETEHLKEEDFLKTIGSFFEVGNSVALGTSFLLEVLAKSDLHIPRIDL
ncbi:hypothetical protein C8J56DRAFT_1169252 [Mycena floridula]|nr:hypothetical protein C8J56DRAFT_1169252 [Mycena floridula]